VFTRALSCFQTVADAPAPLEVASQPTDFPVTESHRIKASPTTNLNRRRPFGLCRIATGIGLGERPPGGCGQVGSGWGRWLIEIVGHAKDIGNMLAFGQHAITRYGSIGEQ
jgi:hypothetical protein